MHALSLTSRLSWQTGESAEEERRKFADAPSSVSREEERPLISSVPLPSVVLLGYVRRLSFLFLVVLPCPLASARGYHFPHCSNAILPTELSHSCRGRCRERLVNLAIPKIDPSVLPRRAANVAR